MKLDEKFVRELGALVRKHVDARLEPLRRELAELRATTVKYRGTWQRAERYTRGDAITHEGALWCCVRDDAEQKPGTGDQWQLMHKSHAGR